MKPLLALSLASAFALAAGSAQAAKTLRDCPTCPELTVVPAGQFVMGADGGEEGRPEGPPHQVTIRNAFALATHETTQAQFERFVAKTGYQVPPGCDVWPKGKVAFAVANWRAPGYDRAPRPRDAVVCVSWTDAKAFTAWLTKTTGKPYRLPTEAEWEYAARAGAKTAFPWGEDVDCRYTNTYDAAGAGRFNWAAASCDDGEATVSEVGRYPANAFGLRDMIGNVWEWTEDCYIAPYPADHATDVAVQPAAGETCGRRAVRGGSWATRPDRNRVAFRGRDPVDARYFMFGFRVARDLTPAEAKAR
ncbi:MAG: formylglycine-generating enzyme family protein [Pseudomonadota bacterium]|uniref:formylglycine-generating enzyme family protein n=1 Tax=Phenylobacterium sp. TaxID=1871053 RepID=UPI0025F18FA3|nr:formylglycine-generating enzyme family protein [Phenylobacterium sp.]MBT9470541.1 formylglycine-generating enzyme family protein [Phenylobacterium sp.]